MAATPALASRYDASYDPRGLASCSFLLEALLYAAVFSVVRMALNRTLFAALGRACLGRPTRRALDKWNDTIWRALCYTASVAASALVASRGGWLSDVDAAWDDPHRYGYTDAGRRYILASLGFYVHLLGMQAVEERKKDFWAMFVHHIATIILVFMSYFFYLTPIGTLILLLHDVSDPLMEFGKLCKYANYQRVADVLFVAFAVVFGVSRLYYFPVYVIRSTYENSVPLYPWAYQGLGLLCLLCVLHVYWYSIIARMAVGFITKGGVGDDARSGDDSGDADDGRRRRKKNT